MKIKFFTTVCILLGLYIPFAFAENQINLNPLHEIFDAQPEQQRIVSITGIVHNEQDESFGIHFAIYRQNQHYQALASISDINQNKIIWQNSATIIQSKLLEDGDHIGPFFWSSSPINSSLIIGYNDGLHLKFDLLEPTNITPTSSLTKSLKIKQYWSGQINGHIFADQKEQFVTGQGAWLQQIWQNYIDQNNHPFQELLCKFDDGQSLTALQLHEADAIRAASVGRFDARGQKQNVSQFLNLRMDDQKQSKIQIGKTDEFILLQPITSVSHSEMYAARLEPEQTIGFCVYQTNPWLSLSQISPPLPKETNSFFKKTLALTKKPFKIALNLKNKSTS